MEFLYRAGDERRSRSSSPPAPAPSALGAYADDGRPAAGADAEEARRQAEKARIRERIMREETVDRFELELEVRLDLVERFRRTSVLNASGPQVTVEPPPVKVIAANTSSLVVPKANSNGSALAASLAKRKNPIHGAAPIASADTSSKKQKLSLTCAVCGITANADKAMQDHLNGKNHKRKAAALAAQPTTEPMLDEAEEGDDFKPKKFFMATKVGALNQVTQMDGYLLCEVCNVRTADCVTMMCHLEGTKHISKAQKKLQATGEPLASSTPPKKCATEHPAQVTVVASTVAGSDPETVVLEVEGEPHTVRREGGSLLCERCGVKTPSESISIMRSHLSGKKHKNKANSSSVATVFVTSFVKEASKEQVVCKDTVSLDESASEIEAPLAKAMQEKVGDRRSELQDNIVATSANKDMVAVKNFKAVEKEAAKVMTGAPASAVNTTAGSELVMEADGVHHPLRRVGCILICPCCDVKATSDSVMRSHLVGKKHKNKMTTSAMTTEVINVPNTGKAGGEADTGPPTTMKAKNAAGAPVVPMEKSDAPAEVEAAITPTEPADDTAEPAGKSVKIQVEGKMFTVLRQENGRLSCELCGVHGCNKDDMLNHLYTRMHWDKACLVEDLAREAAAALFNGGSPAGEGTAPVKK